MKLSRRRLLAFLPIIPTNLVLADSTVRFNDQESIYIAKIIENVFGLFNDHPIITKFIDILKKDTLFIKDIANIGSCNEFESNEIESKIAEKFMIETNYLELCEGKVTKLQLREVKWLT